jgi:hypothetical protein
MDLFIFSLPELWFVYTLSVIFRTRDPENQVKLEKPLFLTETRFVFVFL